jgi:DNA-binding XRE family transcriptional regulator
MLRKTHEELVKKALSKPSVKQAYDNLGEEFALLREIVKIRYELGKTQEEVARNMGTTTSVVGRLETGGGKSHSPTLATLRKYAQALDCDLQLHFVPHSHHCNH